MQRCPAKDYRSIPVKYRPRHGKTRSLTCDAIAAYANYFIPLRKTVVKA